MASIERLGTRVTTVEVPTEVDEPSRPKSVFGVSKTADCRNPGRSGR